MTIAPIDGFDEHFEPPSTLPDKLPTAFYQTKAFGISLACISLVGAAGFSALAYRALNQNWAYWEVPIYLNTAAYFAILSYHLLTKSYYTDQNARRKIREELEQDPSSIHDFIELHGWDNIRRYGLHIAPNLEPIASKDQMHAIAFIILKDDPISFFNRIELNKTYLPINAGSFWEMIDHNLFTEKEIDGFAQKLASNVHKISLVNLLANYPKIKEFKLDRYFHQKQVTFLNHQLDEFNKTKRAYIKKVSDETDSFIQFKRYSPYVKFILDVAFKEGDPRAIVVGIVLVIGYLIIYSFFLAIYYIGKELAIRTAKVLDPTFSLQSTNAHLDLVQHLDWAEKKFYLEIRKETLDAFEQKWAPKQLEFHSLSKEIA